MDMKKILIGLILVCLVSCIGCVGAVDLSQKVTVEMGGVMFDVPPSNNNTTNEYKVDLGTTYAYEDYENNISVYVQTFRSEDMSTQEQWDEYTGYSQSRPVGDMWVQVCADEAAAKDFVWASARAKE